MIFITNTNSKLGDSDFIYQVNNLTLEAILFSLRCGNSDKDVYVFVRLNIVKKSL